MKVRCLGQSGDYVGPAEERVPPSLFEEYPQIVVGKCYAASGISYGEGPIPYLRIDVTSEVSKWMPASLFEVLDGSFSSVWSVAAQARCEDSESSVYRIVIGHHKVY